MFADCEGLIVGGAIFNYDVSSLQHYELACIVVSVIRYQNVDALDVARELYFLPFKNHLDLLLSGMLHLL